MDIQSNSGTAIQRVFATASVGRDQSAQAKAEFYERVDVEEDKMRLAVARESCLLKIRSRKVWLLS